MTTSPLRDQWLTEDGPDEVTGHERSSTERVSFWKVFDGVIGQVAGEIQGGGGGQEGVSHGSTALAAHRLDSGPYACSDQPLGAGDHRR